MGFFPNAPSSVLEPQASTGVNGYTLVNAAGNIISWTPPNDGNLHRFQIFGAIHVTSAETGGQIVVNYTLPDGTAVTHTVFPANMAAGDSVPAQDFAITIKAGTSVTIAQLTVLSAGSAELWAEIWGS